MKINYKIKEVKPNVFAVIIKDGYDRAMTFCRGQEYYESPNSKFRGKDFSIWDYMKWYNSEYHKGFSYGADWSGFNIPYDVVRKCYERCDMETPYDETMWDIVMDVERKMDMDTKAYIIGAANTNDSTFQHESCHGLYYTNKRYKELVDEITITIPVKDYITLRKNLTKMGYTDKVMNDEIQAYLAFGHDYDPFMKGVSAELCNELHKQYINVFNNF
jgi:hypothetical protein